MSNFEKQKEKITPEMDVNETDCCDCSPDCPAADLCNRYPEAHPLAKLLQVDELASKV